MEKDPAYPAAGGCGPAADLGVPDVECEARVMLDNTRSPTRRVVNALFTVFELFCDRLIFWLPLYYELKVGRSAAPYRTRNTPASPACIQICFVIWLTLPRFQGATILYNSFVRQVREQSGRV